MIGQFDANPGDVQRRGWPLQFAHGAGTYRPGDRFQLGLVAAQHVSVEESLRDAAVGNCAYCRRPCPAGHMVDGVGMIDA